MQSINLKELNWENYTSESIDYIHKESEKALESYRKAFTQVEIKSYILSFLCCISISCLISKIGSILNFHSYIAMTAILGSCMSFILLFRNLQRTPITMPGSWPKKLINDYYEKFKGQDQKRQFAIVKIIYNQEALTTIDLEIIKRNKNLNNAIIIYLITSFTYTILSISGTLFA